MCRYLTRCKKGLDGAEGKRGSMGEVFRSRVGYEVGGNLLGIACLARDFGFTDRQ